MKKFEVIMCYCMKGLKKITKSLLNAGSFILPEHSAQHQADLYLLPLLMEYRKTAKLKTEVP